MYDRYDKYHYCRHLVGFWLAYLHSTLTHSKGQVKVTRISIVNLSLTVADRENITIAII